MPTPPSSIRATRFRLYPERGDKRWYRVLIFPTKRQMYHYYDLRRRRRQIDYAPGRGPVLDHDFEALTTGWRTSRFHDGIETPSNDVGEILFHRNYLGAGVVSHEMTQAAIYFLDHLGHTPRDLSDPDIEERFAGIVGELNRKFWAKYATLQE